MPEQIIPIADIKAHAAAAFADDQPLCACPYPAESEAAAIWRAEYAAPSNQMWAAA
jgi:hypothetical protein